MLALAARSLRAYQRNRKFQELQDRGLDSLFPTRLPDVVLEDGFVEERYVRHEPRSNGYHGPMPSLQNVSLGVGVVCEIL
jgi:hypothetical protein